MWAPPHQEFVTSIAYGIIRMYSEILYVVYPSHQEEKNMYKKRKKCYGMGDRIMTSKISELRSGENTATAARRSKCSRRVLLIGRIPRLFLCDGAPRPN